MPYPFVLLSPKVRRQVAQLPKKRSADRGASEQCRFQRDTNGRDNGVCATAWFHCHRVFLARCCVPLPFWIGQTAVRFEAGVQLETG